MKLNVRFILTTFVTVLIISISSTFVFYSLANRVLMQQQSKSLLNATTSFAFNFQNELQKTDEDFRAAISNAKSLQYLNLDSTTIDFVFTLANDTLINAKEFKIKNGSYLNIRTSSFQKFFQENPTLVLRYSQLKDGNTYYYGRIITSGFLNHIGSKVNADIALVINEAPVEISNPEQNKSVIRSLINASRDLKLKNNFDLYTESLSDSDFLSSLFNPKFTLFPGGKVNFIIFQAFKEGVEFRDTLRIVMMLIIIAGSAITFILVLVSTMKLRKQISQLSLAAEETSKGNLEHRVAIITNDELGHFAETFNKMLDELVRNQNKEKEYSEFIALINQNPTLKEVSDAALSKILKSTHLAFGALHLVQEKELRIISSSGLGKNISNPSQGLEFYTDAINKSEMSEFFFTENCPEIKAGIASIKIQYLMIYPIVYNKETVAILELASELKPSSEVKNYINSISEQLAIGLVNAKSFEQLENLVSELKILNEEYQKQNKHIVEQNDELKQLHIQLREKAIELEQQKERAVELTKVKSEFLASMSHELRTPLISILGLTELMIKDIGVVPKIKDRLKIVDRNGKKLLALINNILEFSKFETGKIEIKKETFLLGEFIEEIYSSIVQLTTEKELQLIMDLPKGKNVLLNTDKTKLEQILLNLIVNAIKFTEKGFVKVKARVENISEIILSVEDSGIGISPENQKLVFDEFKQVDGSTSRKYSGAGLGLAICKKYSEMLGGKISLKSEVGKGSEFTLVFPDVVLDVIEVSQHEFLTVKENELINKNIAQENILLVNDSESACKLISDYLVSYNMKVEVVKNSLATKSLVEEYKYKAIILNPMDNAWQTILQITQSKLNKKTPVILTLILDEQKIGWEPDIFGFVTKLSDGQFLTEYFSNAKKISKHNNESIIIVGKDTDGLAELKNNLQKVSSVKNIFEANNLHDFLLLPQIAQLDHILIDLESLEENALEICYAILINRSLRNKQVTFILPEKISADLDKKLCDKFREIALKVKLHPLDILKYLRDRLRIGEKTVNQKIKLIVEPSDEIIVQAQVPKSNLSKPTVLIVDDDSDALFTIGEYVKELDCETIFAHNGMECLLMLNHVQPDLILLDIMMPKMDGFETVKRIRDDAKLAKLPVIALTAYAMLDNKNVIEKNGFDDLITKPINSQILSAKLSKYISVKSTL